MEETTIMRGYSRPLKDRYVHLSISVATMIKCTCALPLFATLVCVLWSLAFDFEAANRTHCGVYNFLPTVSAVSGGFTPQRYIWQICIALHATQRLMMAVAYYGFHTAVNIGAQNEQYKAAAAVNSLLHLVEVLSLVGLSMITSTDNYKAHEKLFVSFMACAVSYMLLTIVLMRWGRCGRHCNPSHHELRSLRYKTRLFLFHISVSAVATYLFYRHNAYCEPKVYSCFALCEYLLIVSNIVYHGMAAVDFENSTVSISDIFSGKRTSDDSYYHRSSYHESRHYGYFDGGGGGGGNRGGVPLLDSDLMLV